MGGETEKFESAWTTDTLLQHFKEIRAADGLRFEQRFTAQEKQYEQRFSAQEKALILREKQIDRELEHLNKLRSEVLADRGQYVQVAVHDSKEKDTMIWRDSVNKRLTTIETRAITWTAAIGLFFLIMTIVMRFFDR